MMSVTKLLVITVVVVLLLPEASAYRPSRRTKNSINKYKGRCAHKAKKYRGRTRALVFKRCFQRVIRIICRHHHRRNRSQQKRCRHWFYCRTFRCAPRYTTSSFERFTGYLSHVVEMMHDKRSPGSGTHSFSRTYNKNKGGITSSEKYWRDLARKARGTRTWKTIWRSGKVISTGNYRAIVAKVGRRYFVVFPGAQGRQEMQDIKRAGFYRSGKHKYAWRRFYPLYRRIRQYVKHDWNNKKLEWVVAGHSLGSVMAQYFAAKLRVPGNVRLYLFGPPSAGLRNYATYLCNRAKGYRVKRWYTPYLKRRCWWKTRKMWDIVKWTRARIPRTTGDFKKGTYYPMTLSYQGKRPFNQRNAKACRSFSRRTPYAGKKWGCTELTFKGYIGSYVQKLYLSGLAHTTSYLLSALKGENTRSQGRLT